MAEINNSMQRLRQDANGSTYADPLNPNHVIRFKCVRSAKKLGTANTTNYILEVIANDTTPVDINGDTYNDAVSVRLRISGCLESGARKAQIAKAICAQVSTWLDENVMVGFEPTTPPYNTVTQ